MTSKVQHVFRVEPYRILMDLGVEVTQKEGRFFVPNPMRPGTTMWLDGRSLVSSDPQCEIVACGIFDFARYHLGSYGDVIDFLLEHYQTNAQVTPGTAIAALKPTFVESLKGERELFESVINLRNRMNSDENLLDSRMWCQHRGLSSKHGWRSFYITRKSDLLPFLGSDPENPVQLEGEHFIVFPYFINPHTPAWLKIQPIHSKKSVTITLNKSQHAFYGLHTCLADTREIRVYNDHLAAQIAYSSEAHMAHVLIGCVHIGFSAVQETNDYKLRSGVFVKTPRATFGQMAQANAAVEKMLVTSGSEEDASLDLVSARAQTWPAYVLAESTRLLQEEGTEAFSLMSMIDVIREDRSMCEMLIRHLEQVDAKEVISRIQAHLKANQTYNLAGMQVVETPNGYVAKRKNASSPFTNFIIKFEHNVRFEDADDPMMHCGRCVINGEEFPVAIPSRLKLKPAEIPNICLNAITRSGITDQAGLFPQIVDSTLARRLTDVLNIQTAKIKVSLLGIKRLGWNDSRTKFVTPRWEVTAQGVGATSRIPYPHSKFLQSHYDFHEYNVVMNTERITPTINTLMCLLASGVVRSFLHLAVPPVEIMRAPNAIGLLHAIFMAFGQSQPIPFGSQRRSAQNILTKENLSGYPVFGMASDAQVVSGLSYPVFLVSDTGLPFHDTMDQTLFEQTMGYTQDLMSRLVLFCLRNPHQMHSLIPSEFEPQQKEMITEGKHILERCLQIGKINIFETDLPVFENMMASVPVDKVQDFFRYDMPTQCVYIRMRKFPNVLRKPLVDELQVRNAEVRLHGLHYVACPAVFFMDLLEAFYGRSIKLFHQEPELEVEQTFEHGQGEQARSDS